MKIESKFLFSSLLVIGVIVFFFGGSTFLGRYLEARLNKRDDITDAALETIIQLEILIRDEKSALKSYIVLDGDEAEMERFQDYKSIVLDNLEKLEKLDIPELATLRDRHANLVTIANALNTDRLNPEKLKQDIRLIDRLSIAIDDSLNILTETLSTQEAENDKYLERLTFGLAIVRYSGVMIAILIVLLQFRSTFVPISASIQELEAIAKEIGSGQLDRRVHIHTGDEIEELAHEFNSMAQKLQDSYHTLEHKVTERTAKLTQANAQLKETLVELKKTQSQLIQNEKMSSLGQLVAGIAHEINNPVNFIFGNLTHVSKYIDELLELIHCYESHYPQPHSEIMHLREQLEFDFIKVDLTEAVSSMQLGAKRIREIVLSLRTFSRLDEAERKEADIHEGIDSTLMILQHRLKSTSDRPAINIHKDYGEIPLICCYPGQLNQVFMNIFVNAIDALEEFYKSQSPEEQKQTELTIQIRTQLVSESVIHPQHTSSSTKPVNQDDTWLEVTITDNGPGIPDSIRNKLFDPFFTTKGVGQGTGLGLSISHQIIVDQHGGILRCKSSPGQGAKFIIAIPKLPLK